MQEIALVLFGSALVNNLLLTQTLGVSALLGMSTPGDAFRPRLTLVFAATAGFVLVAGTGVNHLFYHGLLLPLGLAYLGLPVFVLVIATITQLTLAGSRCAGRCHRQVYARRNLLIANAAVLGVTLNEIAGTPSLALALLRASGAALGFALVLVLLAGLRGQLTETALPAPFRGPSIVLITAGLMALAFMGFAGMR